MLTHSLEDTEKLAKDFLVTLTPQKQARVAGLMGDLGAGKTAFTQATAKLLDIEETVTSPTFVIEKIYRLKNQKFENFIHIDAYRLESGSELEKLGWREMSSDPTNLIYIEWPEKVADILPLDMIRVSFKHIDEKTRDISW